MPSEQPGHKKPGEFSKQIFSVKKPLLKTLKEDQRSDPIKQASPDLTAKHATDKLTETAVVSPTISFQYLHKNIQRGFLPVLDGLSPLVNALLPHTPQQPHTLPDLLYQLPFPWNVLNTELLQSFYSFCW